MLTGLGKAAGLGGRDEKVTLGPFSLSRLCLRPLCQILYSCFDKGSHFLTGVVGGDEGWAELNAFGVGLLARY